MKVVKENQKLHKGTVEIEGDSATLADKSIFPGDVLWVTDTEIHENRDIAGNTVIPVSILGKEKYACLQVVYFTSLSCLQMNFLNKRLTHNKLRKASGELF